MSLNIPLYDGWRIRSDPHNIILENPEGRCSFFSTIDVALSSFVEKKIRGFDSSSIQGLINAIKDLQQRLNKALQPLNLVVVPSGGET